MPYSGIDDSSLPDYVQELPTAKRKQWIATFNDALANSGDEGEAFRVASSAVRQKSADETAWLELLNGLNPEQQNLIQRAVKWLRNENELALSGFKMMSDDTWVAWYTNSYKDRSGEFFPVASIQKDIDYMEKSGAYPELWFFHIPGTKHGQTTWAGVVGHLAVAVGTFDDTPIAEKMKAYYKGRKLEVSHGFVYNALKKQERTFYDYHTYEISPLPAGMADNPFTAFSTKDVDMAQGLNAKQFDALVEALGGTDDAKTQALAIAQDGNAREKALQAAMVAFKSTPTSTATASDTPTQVSTAASDALLEAIKALTAKVDELVVEVKATKAAPVVTPPEPQKPAYTPLSNERQQAIIAELKLNSTKQAVADDGLGFSLMQIFGEGE